MRSIIFSVVVLGLSACATPQVAEISQSSQMTVAPKQITWHDGHFQADETVLIVPKEEVFALSDVLKEQLMREEIQALSNISKTRYLLDLVYTKDSAAFAYNYKETTTAKTTWENKRGNCISLTILAYSIGRALKLPIVMQEVDIPVQFDRRGNLDFLSSHVNAMIMQKISGLNAKEKNRGYLIVDFEPQTMILHRGRALSDEEILSRFYNNIGAEYLAKQQKNAAYAYFKAAILRAPNNSLAYSNLAELYLQTGLYHQAEEIITHALNINKNDVIVMRNMQKLLQSQNRLTEAATFTQRIEASNAENPHYWLGLGIQAVKNQEYTSAIKYLEKARKMAIGFADIHRYLAEAYLKTGNMTGAKSEISQLINLVPDHPKSILLRNKFAVR